MKERKCANKEIVEVWDKTFECPVFCVIWQQKLFSVNWEYADVLVLQQILYILAAVNSLLFKLGAKWQIETNIPNYFEGMIFALYLGALIGLTAATKKNVLLLVADDFRNIQLFIHGQSCFFLIFCSFRPNLGLYDEANAPLFNSPHMITPHLDRLQW